MKNIIIFALAALTAGAQRLRVGEHSSGMDIVTLQGQHTGLVLGAWLERPNFVRLPAFRLIGIFSSKSLDLETLREFCKREGEAVTYRKGDQLEREGDPARWLALVESGCFKYVTHGISDDREHITWFSFEGEFVADYPTYLYARPARTSIVAMMPSRVLRVTGEQMEQYFDQNNETMKLRAVVAEHILDQHRARYIDFHRTTACERYDMLMQRCPGIVEHLDLQDIASFLNVHPNTISKIRRDITFESGK